jgi:hypothetical protein
MFVGDARTLPKSGEHERFFNQVGYIAFLANIKIGRKGLPRTNTTAYYEHMLITAVNFLSDAN